MMKNGFTLQKGAYGLRAILTSEWSETMGQQLLKEGIVELELNYAAGWSGKDVAFLADLPNLESLKVVHWTINSVEPIHLLHKLKSLRISTYCKTEIQFAQFPELEDCALEWRPKARSLFDCKSLRKLFLNHYDGGQTEPFGKLINLEELTILNAPIKDLRGLSTLQKLRMLRLGGLRLLTSLKGVDKLIALEELTIDTCRKVGSIEEIGSLSRLKKLYLINDGKIQSLMPIRNLPYLESLSFSDTTDIVDGDLSPLIELPHLKKVSFQNRRHYSHSREELRVE